MMNTRYTVSPIPAFADNYIWLIEKTGCLEAIVVDPGDPAPVIKELERRGLVLKAILVTHHHMDHVGGVQSLIRYYSDVEVWTPAKERIAGRTQVLSEGDSVRFERMGLRFEVLDVPGHTAGHIAYYEPRRRWLFCGDTIFVAGCGRVFDGTHADLCASLTRLAALPEATEVYCAHEYTLDNIGFAKWAEPENSNMALFEAECRQRRQKNLPTVPSTIRKELRCNPFLRLAEPAIIAAARAWSENPDCPLSGLDPERPEHTFHLIRNWKDVAYD